MLKNSRLSGTPSIRGNVASTTARPAQSCPAERERSAAEKWSKAVATAAVAGRATATSTIAMTVPSTQM